MIDVKEKFLCSAEETAALLGVGRTLLYAMNSNGKLGPMPVHFGKRVLWCRAELEQWALSNCPNRERWQLMKGKNNG